MAPEIMRNQPYDQKVGCRGGFELLGRGRSVVFHGVGLFQWRESFCCAKKVHGDGFQHVWQYVGGW